MTPDTEVNTEFSLPTVKADLAVSVAERCEEGAAIFKEWVKAYNATVKTPDSDWQAVLGKGMMGYVNHANGCVQCMTFELAMRGRTFTITEEDKK